MLLRKQKQTNSKKEIKEMRDRVYTNEACGPLVMNLTCLV